MKRRLMIWGAGLLLLASCRPAREPHLQSTKEIQPMTTAQVNALILERLARKDFVEIDGTRFFGPDIPGSHSTYYVTKLSRDEVLGILSELLEPHVTAMTWGDDYGQYHGTFRLKSDPTMMLGLGISFLKHKAETFKSAPEILSTYQTDIVYTEPVEWNEP